MKLLKIFTLLLTLPVCLCCKQDNVSEEIPFTDYVLTEPSCSWTNIVPNKVIIINSENDLKNYTTCTESIPVVDFSKYTLLLAHGEAIWGINSVTKIFFKTNDSKYTLKVTISCNMATVMSKWTISIITLKIPDDVVVALDVH